MTNKLTTTSPQLTQQRAGKKTSTIRLVSLLPFITDVVHQLGLSHLLVGVSHECESEQCVAAEGRQPGVLTKPKLDENLAMLAAPEIAGGWNHVGSWEGHRLLAQQQKHLSSYHDEISKQLSTELCSFYLVDIQKLIALQPTHILSHISSNSLSEQYPDDGQSQQHAVEAMVKFKVPTVEEVTSLSANSLSEIYSLHHRIAEILRADAVNVVTNGRALLLQTSSLISQIRRPVQKKPSVAIVQWTDPLYLTGGFAHEILELIGADIHCRHLPRAGQPSSPISTLQLLSNFDHVVFVPCALPLQDGKRLVDEWWFQNVHSQYSLLVKRKNIKFAVVDGTKLFSWLGLSVVATSAQVLAEIIYDIQWFGHKNSFWQRWAPSV